jgi:hypothetical protein
MVGRCVARVDAGERRTVVMRAGSTGDGGVSRDRTAGISRIWGSAFGSLREAAYDSSAPTFAQPTRPCTTRLSRAELRTNRGRLVKRSSGRGIGLDC